VNLTEAVQELKARGFDYVSDSRARIMLNNAKNAFEDEYDWPWLETTTTTGAAPLTITDLKHVLYVVDTTNGTELRGTDSRGIADIDSNVSTAGVPSSWWLDGGSTLRVYPTSTTAQLSVRYVRCSPDLSAGSDAPLIPSRLHPVWIDYAVVEAYKDDDRFNEAQALLGFVRANRLPQIIETYGDRNRQNPDTQVIVAGSEDW
jgi:hypothetical protein